MRTMAGRAAFAIGLSTSAFTGFVFLTFVRTGTGFATLTAFIRANTFRLRLCLCFLFGRDGNLLTTIAKTKGGDGKQKT